MYEEHEPELNVDSNDDPAVADYAAAAAEALREALQETNRRSFTGAVSALQASDGASWRFLKVISTPNKILQYSTIEHKKRLRVSDSAKAAAFIDQHSAVSQRDPNSDPPTLPPLCAATPTGC